MLTFIIITPSRYTRSRSRDRRWYYSYEITNDVVITSRILHIPRIANTHVNRQFWEIKKIYNPYEVKEKQKTNKCFKTNFYFCLEKQSQRVKFDIKSVLELEKFPYTKLHDIMNQTKITPKSHWWFL